MQRLLFGLQGLVLVAEAVSSFFSLIGHGDRVDCDPERLSFSQFLLQLIGHLGQLVLLREQKISLLLALLKVRPQLGYLWLHLLGLIELSFRLYFLLASNFCVLLLTDLQLREFLTFSSHLGFGSRHFVLLLR